jgi:hypothetical protein
MAENGNGAKSITEIIREGTAIEEALDKAFYRAVLLHRQAGVPMTFCDKAGNIVKEDAKDIPIPEKYADLEPFRY